MSEQIPLLERNNMSTDDTIRIINGNYKFQFSVENMGFVEVDMPHGTFTFQLQYINDTHFKVIGGQPYHICQFGEVYVDKCPVRIGRDTQGGPGLARIKHWRGTVQFVVNDGESILVEMPSAPPVTLRVEVIDEHTFRAGDTVYHEDEFMKQISTQYPVWRCLPNLKV